MLIIIYCVLVMHLCIVLNTEKMKTSANFKMVMGSVLLMMGSIHNSTAQTFTVSNSASTLEIDGTSNIHDWTIVAKDQKGKLEAEIVEGQLVKISQLEFTVVAESLKSGKSGMDKNTYKALNTGKYKEIVYKMGKVNNIDCVSAGSCKITTSGTLTVAGTSKPIDITFDAKVTGDKIILTGNKTLKMTDFKIDPPKAVFGTITTGDKLEITFKTTYLKK